MPSQGKIQHSPTLGGFFAEGTWFVFKFTFGLFSLATVWTTAVLKNSVLGASDTEEEKQELALGTLVPIL